MTTAVRKSVFEKATEFIFNHIGFNPTELQKPILNSKKRFTLVAGGEQAG